MGCFFHSMQLSLFLFVLPNQLSSCSSQSLVDWRGSNLLPIRDSWKLGLDSCERYSLPHRSIIPIRSICHGRYRERVLAPNAVVLQGQALVS